MRNKRKYAFLTFIIIFLFFQIYFYFGTIPKASKKIIFEKNRFETFSEPVDFDLVPKRYWKYLTPKPGTNSSKPLDIAGIKAQIALYNRQEKTYNNDFSPLEDDSLVIVVQTHNRINYLRHLIISLAQARHIAQAFLIFSHDYYDEEINTLIQSIDFCEVIQIFYPYSIQTHPREFPGEDPNDCPRNISPRLAFEKKCNNALYPDKYGHYREASFTQIKHHWWWKANTIFNDLELTRYFNGLVLFLEEDHYVAKDFIHVLNMMADARNKFCKHCNILSLGSYKQNFQYKDNEVELIPWMGSTHNMGMAFNRSTWQNILECSDFFCKHDDYNWDWTLHQVSLNCTKNQLYAMVVKSPRIFHIGECGIHHKKKKCVVGPKILKLQQILDQSEKFLFPQELHAMYVNLRKPRKTRKANGGWADPRDHELCLNMTIKQT